MSGVVSLEIADSEGKTIARFRSDDPVPPLDPRYSVPVVWARPPRVLSAAPGHHRFLWDMQYPQVPGMATGPDDDMATPHDTPSVSTAPWVMPGDYTVRLVVGGKTLMQRLKVAMDPRVKTPLGDLESQFKLAKGIYDNVIDATTALHEVSVLREQLKARASQPPVANAGPSIESKLDAIAGPERGGRGGMMRGPSGPPTLSSVRMILARLEHSIENADVAPTAAQDEAYATTMEPLAGLLDQWKQLKQTELKSLNERLKREHLAAIHFDTRESNHGIEDHMEMGDEE
jgi:hypothetical protein